MSHDPHLDDELITFVKNDPRSPTRIVHLDNKQTETTIMNIAKVTRNELEALFDRQNPMPTRDTWGGRPNPAEYFGNKAADYAPDLARWTREFEAAVAEWRKVRTRTIDKIVSAFDVAPPYTTGEPANALTSNDATDLLALDFKDHWGAVQKRDGVDRDTAFTTAHAERSRGVPVFLSNDDGETDGPSAEALLAMSFADHVNAVQKTEKCSRNRAYEIAHRARTAGAR